MSMTARKVLGSKPAQRSPAHQFQAIMSLPNSHRLIAVLRMMSKNHSPVLAAKVQFFRQLRSRNHSTVSALSAKSQSSQRQSGLSNIH